MKRNISRFPGETLKRLQHHGNGPGSEIKTDSIHRIIFCVGNTMERFRLDNKLALVTVGSNRYRPSASNGKEVHHDIMQDINPDIFITRHPGSTGMSNHSAAAGHR